MDEREAFEAFKAANDLEDHEGTAWLAWQKRASLAATQAVAEVTDGHFEVSDGSKFPYKVAVLNEVGDKLPPGTKLYAAPVLETATQASQDAFVIQALVAAGHVTQQKVDEAYAIAGRYAAPESSKGDNHE